MNFRRASSGGPILLLFAITLCVPGGSARGQLPHSCNLPPAMADAIHTNPGAAVYDAIGASFAGKGNLPCAVAAFNEATRLDPQSPEAHYDLGVALVRLKQLRLAADQFRLAVKAKPDSAQFRNSLGAVLLDMGRAGEAQTEFENALQSDSKSVFALDHLAQALSAQRHYSAAIRYWNQALAVQPDSPDLLLSLGIATYENGDAAGSIRILTELVKAHPDLKSGHFNLANIFAHESRFREAADEYAQVLRLDPQDEQARLAMVKALVTVAAYQDALAPAQAYIRRNPADPAGHLLLGSVYRGLGEYDKAESELKLAVAARSKDADAQYQLGFVLARNGKPKEALSHLEKAVELKPTDTAAQFQLIGVLRRLGDSARATQVEQDFKKAKEHEFTLNQVAARGNQANELLQAGQPSKAAEVYRQMLQIEPNNARTEYNLALALDAAHDIAGERQALERAVSLDPQMGEARGELGRLDLAAGDLESAERWLRSALEDNPQLASARGNLAVVDAIKGDDVQAEKLLRQALQDNPNYAQGHLNLGLILAQQKNFAAAESELDKALKLMPNDPKALSAAGKVKVRLGKSTDGIALLREVITLAPQSAAAHLDLAIALADSYNLPAALAEATIATELAPGAAASHFNRGRVLFDLGKVSEARAEFETASRLAPQMAEPHYYLAIVEEQSANYAAAISCLQTVVKLEPQNASAWYLLGQNLEREAQMKEAVAAWKQAIAIDPDYSQALWKLSRALRPTSPAQAELMMARYESVQRKRRILDRAGTLGNDAVASMRAHEMLEAVRELKEAIGVCGNCAIQADLHKNLGLAYCQIGNISKGEQELLIARRLQPGDPDIRRALALIEQARSQRGTSQTEKAQ
jgi:tetratricopeptide (TPR) repeat protein